VITSMSSGTKLLAWVLFVVVLPFLSLIPVRKILDLESNIKTFLLLTSLTLVDIFAALLLTGSWDLSLWMGIILITASAASGYYNYLICSLILKYGG